MLPVGAPAGGFSQTVLATTGICEALSSGSFTASSRVPSLPPSPPRCPPAPARSELRDAAPQLLLCASWEPSGSLDKPGGRKASGCPYQRLAGGRPSFPPGQAQFAARGRTEGEASAAGRVVAARPRPADGSAHVRPLASFIAWAGRRGHGALRAVTVAEATPQRGGVLPPASPEAGQSAAPRSRAPGRGRGFRPPRAAYITEGAGLAPASPAGSQQPPRPPI